MKSVIYFGGMTFLLALSLTACAHQYLHERVRKGMTMNEVRKEMGEPDLVRVLDPVEGWTYTITEGFSQTATYELVFQNGRMVGQGGSGFAGDYAMALELRKTPFERCTKNDEWKRHGEMRTCIEEKRLEADRWNRQQQERAASKAAAIQARRSMALQMLLNRPSAPYQPPVIQTPSPVYMPTQLPPQPVNCLSRPDGIGGVRTSCQ